MPPRRLTQLTPLNQPAMQRAGLFNQSNHLPTRRTRLALVTLLLVILLGCALPGEITPDPVVETRTPQVSASETSPSTSTPPSTSAPTKTEPVIPRASNTPLPRISPTQAPTITHTPVPTLPQEQAKLMLRELIANNGGNPPNLFWGIAPGETNLDDAKALFRRLRYTLRLVTTQNDYEYFWETINYDDLANFSISISSAGGVVQGVKVNTSFMEENTIAQVWPPYSLKELIAQDNYSWDVEFFTHYIHDRGYENTAWYSLSLYSRDLRIIVLYLYAPMNDNGQLARVCPAKDQFESVTVWFGANPEDPPISGKKLSEVTGLTLDEFRMMFLEGSGSACFELNTDAFFP